MTFLPIVARELRVASRRRSTYWVRCGAALALIIIGTWLFLMMQQQPPQEISIFLFEVLTAIAVLHCLVRGVWSTSDCLSEEKREGTLGLLFLTDLKGYDVVFGKLAATSLNGFYGLLAVVPLMAVPLLMGGVTLGEFGRMALVAINALFFSLSLGICISALSRSAHRAMAMSFVFLFVFTGVLPAAAAWIAYLNQSPKIPTHLLLPSVGCSYYFAFDKPYRTGQIVFLQSMLVIHGLSWLFLALACVIAPRSWRERPAGVERLRWREQWRSWSYGDVSERTAYRRHLLARNAYYWLAARARLKPAHLWSVLGLLACAWAWGVAKFHRDWLNQGVYLMTAGLLVMLLKTWFALEAGQQLAEDRKRGALELLLSTPMTVHDILHGQFLALKRQFLGPLVAVLCVFSLFMAGESSEAVMEEDRRWWTLFWSAVMLMLVVDLAALYWLGMWQGLTARSPTRAASASVTLILVLPWIAFALLSLLFALASLNGDSGPGPGFFLGLWFGLGIATDIGFGAWARHKLLNEFRSAAAQRFAAPRGFWKRLLGRNDVETV
jgi:ABC-type transport system involved in multi-copper enzyme maturation permease subunit